MYTVELMANYVSTVVKQLNNYSTTCNGLLFDICTARLATCENWPNVHHIHKTTTANYNKFYYLNAL